MSFSVPNAAPRTGPEYNATASTVIRQRKQPVPAAYRHVRNIPAFQPRSTGHLESGRNSTLNTPLGETRAKVRPAITDHLHIRGRGICQVAGGMLRFRGLLCALQEPRLLSARPPSVASDHRAVSPFLYRTLIEPFKDAIRLNCRCTIP